MKVSEKVDSVLDMLESYIKSVRLQAVYVEVGKLYNQNEQEKAQNKLMEYAEWLGQFTLKSKSVRGYYQDIHPAFPTEQTKGE